MKLAIDIADILVETLNSQEAGTFPEDFTAHRRVLPNYELSELKDLTVTVVPKSIEITPASRDMNYRDVSIDIGIQQKIGTDTDAEVSRLSELVDAIAVFLSRRSLGDSAFKSIANDPIYVPEHLLDKRLFTSIITVTYRTMR